MPGSILAILIAATAGAAPHALPSGAALSFRQEADVQPGAPLPAFGERRSWYWTLSGGVALHSDSTDAGAYLGMGTFLADGFEFNFGVSGWHFAQEGDDADGVNPSLGFRYHFAPRERVDWYADAGIGLLLTSDDVPGDGESINFTPRAGVGALIRLGESGTRLDVGVGWRHISTASTTGSDDNPSRDSVMIYAGLVFPF